MRSIVLAVGVVAAVAVCALHYLPEGQAEAEAAGQVRAQEIQSISIDGSGLPLASLRAVLKTRVGELLDARSLEHDRDALESALAAQGYLAARVEPAVVTFATQGSGGAFVTFAVAQGAMFHLRSVSVTGATARDAGVVTLTAGEDAAADHIERARQLVAGNLARRGKPSHVEVAMHSDVAAALVDVVLVTR